ncbi:unnamed protein product [Rhizophagus irregularis]|nr:unnamed protein product [Rhizophagus irregularis]
MRKISTCEKQDINHESKMSSSSTIAERLEGYETKRLIDFLRGDSELSHIELGDGFFTRLEEEKITSHLFSS